MEDYIKINTDVTFNVYSERIGVGGLARNSDGTWIKGFIIDLGMGDDLQAEMWGIW